MQEKYKQLLGADLWLPIEALPGRHFDLLNFQTFLQDLGYDKGKLKQNYCLGFRKALTSDLKLEPLIRVLSFTQVNEHPCSAI